MEAPSKSFWLACAEGGDWGMMTLCYPLSLSFPSLDAQPCDPWQCHRYYLCALGPELWAASRLPIL